MYYEDLLETAINNEYSVDFKLRQKNTEDTVKVLDKNYEKYVVLFNNTWKDGKFYKYITIQSYGSGGQGTKVRNAVTGARYNIIVGSCDEDILFKVTDSNGHNGRKDPLILYYDTPEQYENHQFTVVPTEVKKRWLTRSLDAQRRLSN